MGRRVALLTVSSALAVVSCGESGRSDRLPLNSSGRAGGESVGGAGSSGASSGMNSTTGGMVGAPGGASGFSASGSGESGGSQAGASPNGDGGAAPEGGRESGGEAGAGPAGSGEGGGDEGGEGGVANGGVSTGGTINIGGGFGGQPGCVADQHPITRASDCEFVLSAATTGTIDVNRINVTINSDIVPRVTSCTADSNGWFLQPSIPYTIELCSGACNFLLNSPTASVTILIGCQTIVERVQFARFEP